MTILNDIKHKGALIAYRDELRNIVDEANLIIEDSRDYVNRVAETALCLQAKATAVNGLMSIEFFFQNHSDDSL